MYVARQESATAARELAGAAHDDGARGLGRMARLGARGKHASNIERDMHRLASSCTNAKVRLYRVMTTKLQRWGLERHDVPHDVLLPHEFLGLLYRARADQFHEIMGTSKLVEYWAAMRRAGQSWYRQHPSRAEIEATGGQYLIPGRIFG